MRQNKIIVTMLMVVLLLIGGVSGGQYGNQWSSAAPKHSKGAATFVIAANDASVAVKSVADYRCDGTADNVQIQTALTACVTNGGTVELSEGTFNIITPLIVGNKLKLKGQGPATIVKVTDDVQDIAITCLDRTNGNTDITLENFTINGNKENQDGPGSPANYAALYTIYTNKYPGSGGAGLGCVDFRKCSRVRISKVTIYDGFPSCLELATCDDCVITENVIHDSGDDCIGVNLACHDCTVSNNVIYNPGVSTGVWATTSGHGVEVQDGSYSVSIFGNTIRDGTASGIEVSSHAVGGVCYDVTISGNVIRDCTDCGVSITSVQDPASQHTGISIVGNNFWNLGTRTMLGVQIQGGNNINIASNTFNSCEVGVRITTDTDAPTSNNLIIAHNNFIGVTTNSIVAIKVDHGALTITGLCIIGNTMKDFSPAIYLWGGTGSNLLVINGFAMTGNVITTARTNATTILASTTGVTVNGLMFNNIIDKNGTGQWFKGVSDSLDPASVAGTWNNGNNYYADGTACPIS